MSSEQRISGIYRLVTNAAFYEAFQNLLGAKGGRERYFREWVTLGPDHDVLDIGCGPATCTGLMRYGSYLGIDLNPPHIVAARDKGFADAEFREGAAQDVLPGLDRTFDAVFSMGFLHHLNDDSVTDLVGHVLGCLRPGGTVYFLEPVRLEPQRLVARALKDRDSGQHIRDEAAYCALLERPGTRLETRITHDMLRVPYDHFWGRLTWS